MNGDKLAVVKILFPHDTISIACKHTNIQLARVNMNNEQQKHQTHLTGNGTQKSVSGISAVQSTTDLRPGHTGISL